MNIGIVGTGSIAAKLAEAINNVDGAVLYAISSRTLKKSRDFAEQYGVKVWYEGTNDFYKNRDIDLVYIATPNSLHKSNTLEALNNNKAVLCEKPFALNYEESIEMIDTAREKGIFVAEAMWTKYFPAIKRVKEILENGSLGNIQTIQGDFSYPLSRDNDRLYRKELGGGALLDLGIYPITVSHLFLGIPDRIIADCHYTKEGVDESTSMIFSYKSGAKALITCSLSTFSTNEFTISCTKGWIRLNGSFHNPSSISYFIDGVGEQHQEFPLKSDGYEYQIEGILEDFNNGLIESSTVKQCDTLEIMKIMDIVRDKIGYSFND